MRAVTAVGQLDSAPFELVVVCDSESHRRLLGHPLAKRLKSAVLDAANISAARNIGLSLAAAGVVAFLDDDAVPEPTWLARLVAPFENPEITATGGFVRGRNGVSFQWKASMADRAGRVRHASPDAHLPEGVVWRTEGTNMAFRRSALAAIGGFDERLHFFLDETDVNRRLPGKTQIVPEAEVHHGFEASARRRADRVPQDLSEIGASLSIFLNAHAPEQKIKRIIEMRREQKARLIRHMVAGRLEPRDVKHIMASYERGLSAGDRRAPAEPRDFNAPPPFLPLQEGQLQPMQLFAGNASERADLEDRAKRYVAQGGRATLILFNRSARFLQVRFGQDGVWRHVGGQFGRGERSDPMIQIASHQRRIATETARIVGIRGV